MRDPNGLRAFARLESSSDDEGCVVDALFRLLASVDLSAFDLLSPPPLCVHGSADSRSRARPLTGPAMREAEVAEAPAELGTLPSVAFIPLRRTAEQFARPFRSYRGTVSAG